MATSHTLPASASGAAPPAASENAVAATAEQALVPVTHEEEEIAPINPVLARMPVELDVAVPVRDFRVRNLLALNAGQVVETDWSHGEDMPLCAGDVQLAWSEFEVVDTELAVRVTRLA
jgi:flagellar motor switch/type III secretory pathway protein FliN